MIERDRAWRRAALAVAMLATASLGGCSGTIVQAPCDAAVSDLVVMDTPPAVDVPAVDASPAVDRPLTCGAGATLCAAACVDTAANVSHCGACDRACATGEACVVGTCTCAAGWHPVGTVCVADDAPRPLAPISLGDVTQRRPTLRWSLPPGVDGAVVELCRDRACTMVIETLRVTGTSARPAADLPARSTVFWRMHGLAGTTERTGVSPTWIFHVPAMSASTAVDTSFNPHFDVNGDGFDDVLVGSRGARPGASDRVATASVFYGSATWTQPPAGTAHTPDRIFEAGSAGGEDFNTDNFAVGAAGDVNGDGYADLIIGTADADPGGRHAAGTASVFYGSATWTRPAAGAARTPDRLLEGAAADDYFGFSVAGAGDVNGDGYADLLVGARIASGGRRSAGTASVFYGSATWSQPAAGAARTPDRLLEGDAVGYAFGWKLAGAGDVNGDGYADLAVLGFLELDDPMEGSTTSTTSVFYGSATWDQPAPGTSRTPDRFLQGVAGDAVNPSLASAGDVNGDGYADLVVGAGLAAPGGRRSAGKASVYYGSATWTQAPAGTAHAPDRLLEGEEGDWFGTSVASAGDVNGDGYADLVVGAYAANKASVFYGSATWTQPPAGTARTADRLIHGAATNRGFGWSVAGAGDVNGDGYTDLVVGAHLSDPGGREGAGTASVYYGSATWTPSAMGTPRTADRLLEGTVEGDWFGVVVASTRDVDGDAYAELLAGASLFCLAWISAASAARTSNRPHDRTPRPGRRSG